MGREQGRLQRTTIAGVQVLGLAVWFSATAVGPSLQQEWGISSGMLVWLTSSVQVGFVVGAVASTVLRLADRFPPQILLAACAICASTTTGILALAVDSFGPAVVLRFFTGVFLAGIYPVGMKLMASWAAPKGRGKAFGILIGALTVGSAMPHLISGFGPLPWRQVMGASAALGILAAIISLAWIKTGPYADNRKPSSSTTRYAMAAFRQRLPRLANIGYFGHMWELYALWTWIPMFIIKSQQDRDAAETLGVGLTVFVTMGIGGVVGSMLGGWAADRWGRPQAAAAALAISGTCCLISPLLFGSNDMVLFAFLLVWGAAVIADSGVFSTVLSETVDQRIVGTSLTMQTAIGFLLTVISIQFVPLFAEIVGWQYAFVLLLPGPVLGVLAMHTMASIKQTKGNQKNENDLAVYTPFRRSNSPVVAHRH